MAQHFRWHKTVAITLGAGENWRGIPTQDLGASYKMRPAVMSQCYVRSASTDTTFDVIVEDDHGYEIRRFLTCTEVCNDLTLTPIIGDIKIKIENASASEDFKVLVTLTTE